MQASPPPLTPEEMREQLRAFAERSSSSHAARSVRYEQGMAHPEEAWLVPENSPVPLDLAQPTTPNDWQCTGCGMKLDGRQLKIHYSRRAFNNQHIAMCPHCGGVARNLHQAACDSAAEEENRRIVQKTNLRNIIICSAVLLSFLLVPSVLTYVCCWITALWFGPLREVHPKMKLGAMMVVMVGAFFGNLLAILFEVAYFGLIMVWLQISLLIVGAGWMIERLSSFGGGLFYRG